MLTVDFDRLGIGPGSRVLDLGCGQGRHAFEALRRGATVTAADIDTDALEVVAALAAAMGEAGEAPAGASLETIEANALDTGFKAATFDVVIASEILEHIPEDRRAMTEIARVLKPGGAAAITVPRYLPERVCWMLSKEYHSNPGGHVRIYRGHELTERLAAAGLEPVGVDHAHALHSPYWWLKCAVGVRKDDSPLPRLYHRFLVWDLVNRPGWTRALERGLDPLLGKSLVVYTRKTRKAVPARRAPRRAHAPA